MFHIHVLLVAPLGAGHMAQPGTDQHQSRVAVWVTTHELGTATDLSIQSFNNIVGSAFISFILQLKKRVGITKMIL